MSVTTRTPQHGEVTVAAAAAGVKGVLCEKAMATSLHEADAMIEACRRSGTKLMINHTRRWHPTYVAAARLLEDGAIGTLRCIVGICPAPLIHNGTHLFDLMRSFGGGVAWTSGEIHPDVLQDVPGTAMLLFRSGAVGFVDLDSSLGFGIELQGEAGRILIDAAADGLTMWQYRSPASSPSGRAWYQGGPCEERAVRQIAGEPAKGTLISALDELFACIEHDGECTSSGQDSRAALELALAVHQSHARGGERMILPLQDRTFAVQSR